MVAEKMMEFVYIIDYKQLTIDQSQFKIEFVGPHLPLFHTPRGLIGKKLYEKLLPRSRFFHEMAGL